MLSGVKEIREAVDQSRRSVQIGLRTLLFIDEVHRFNKSQQDALLPHVEDGTFLLVGATTENPSFEINNALLSRTRTYVLKPIDRTDLLRLLDRALGEMGLAADPEAVALIAELADGDARRALNLLEQASDLADGGCIVSALVATIAGEGIRRFDKGGDVFHDQISALHKSVRGSAPDASLYWLARMLKGGCDPHYLARRLVRMASEDIGNADPRALALALDAWDSQDRLGSPEGELALAQAVVYLACAAKSNAVYTAWQAAQADAHQQGSREVPKHLRNAPTRLMQSLGFGKNYRYAHDEPNAYASGERYFPDDMPDRIYYQPVPRGLEIQIGEKLARLREMDRAARTTENGRINEGENQ